MGTVQIAVYLDAKNHIKYFKHRETINKKAREFVKSLLEEIKEEEV